MYIFICLYIYLVQIDIYTDNLCTASKHTKNKYSHPSTIFTEQIL